MTENDQAINLKIDIGGEWPLILFRKRDIQICAVVPALTSVAAFALPWVAIVGLVIVTILTSLKLRRPALIVVCLFGLTRGWLALPQALPPSPAELVGPIVTDPIGSGFVRFEMKSQLGRVLVRGRMSEVRFGDEIQVTCEKLGRKSIFRAPECRASTMKRLRSSAPLGYSRGLRAGRDWLEAAIDRMLPSPESGLQSGILLGTRTGLPPELNENFRVTGTSHIVAVSGFNVTIVIALMAGLISRLPLPRRLITAVIIFSVISFVILTGASASVVRAGIMGGLVVLARATGRLSDAGHALVISAAAMVVVDPMTLADVGFQLSVAATAGLVLLSEPIEAKLSKIPTALGLRGSLSSTLAAIIATTPVIALVFGRVSLIAPLVNVLVLPLIPIAMGLGFVAAVVCGLISGAAIWIGWLAWLPLTLAIRLVDVAAGLPFASVGFGGISSVIVAAASAGLATVMIGRKKHGHT